VIEAGEVNAYRTAASDAVAADLLARQEARVLAIFGAGNQALFEVAALARIRSIDTVLVVARPSPRRDAFVAMIMEGGLTARAVPAEEAVRDADIVVAATPSREPLFDYSRPTGSGRARMLSAWALTRRVSTNCRWHCCNGRVCSATCRRNRFRSAISSTRAKLSRQAGWN
jgi:hypothetical protein